MSTRHLRAGGVPTLLAMALLIVTLAALALPQPRSSVATAPSLAKPAWLTPDVDSPSFADPLPIGHDRLLLFRRVGSANLAVVSIVDWRGRRGSTRRLPELDLSKGARYRYQDPRHPEYARFSAIRTSAGTWLVGPQVLLLRDGGGHALRDFDADEPILAGLPDGSVLSFGDRHGKNGKTAERIRRIRPAADGTLTIDDLGPLAYPAMGPSLLTRPAASADHGHTQPRFGVLVQTLPDGRVLMAGGDTTATRAALVDPATGSIRSAAPMPHPRSMGATALLPDGRVVVAGAEHLACYRPAARAVDVYDPVQDRWSALPSLPLPLCAAAYGADAPSLAVAPNGDLIAGGDNERQVMLLRADAERPGGYAASWQIQGDMDEPHIGGVVQAVEDGSIAVAGGVHVDEDGRCCYRTTALDRIDPDAPAPPFRAIGLTLNGTAEARRGNRLFLAAGRAFDMTSSGQMRYSSAAEIVRLPQGQVEQLPQMPFAAGGADAAWLDDGHVLVKGRLATDDRGFERGMNVSSYMPDGSGDVAILDIAARSWRRLALPAQAARARLAGARGGKAYLLATDGRLSALDLASGKIEPLPRPIMLGAQGPASRLLDDGRLVIAGGSSQTGLVSLIEPCEADTGTNASSCPEHFVGFGPAGYSSRVATFATGTTGTVPTAGWSLSPLNPLDISSVAIFADGSVAAFAASGPALGHSDAAGADWKAWPVPPDIHPDQFQTPGCTPYEPACRLLVAPDPRSSGHELLFLRAGNIAIDGPRPKDLRVRIWWFDPDALRWQVVADATGPGTREALLDLPPPLSTPQRRMRSTGWQLDSPVLWLDQPARATDAGSSSR